MEELERMTGGMGGGIIYEGEKIKLFIYGGWREGNNRRPSEEREREKYTQEMKSERISA